MNSGFSTIREAEHDADKRQHGDDQRADVMHDAVGALAQTRSSPIAIASPAQTCSASLGERRGVAIDVAAVDVMADFEERESAP